ncbi:hypothetical protein K503DRAFT_855642 [Rhizopogon vinicolor AM-OR11-026]|uniref:Uncharacterized protein n=1 Tax=Rhizopogon vinicolor AM-OR11-026 TaxID=1314800 RepID=A0A1B7N5B7_9AGAM|nr:hypothetical protein K503DRAFT_855642 [Rhizopogon vinicolor AM-OR11-026]
MAKKIAVIPSLPLGYCNNRIAAEVIRVISSPSWQLHQGNLPKLGTIIFLWEAKCLETLVGQKKEANREESYMLGHLDSEADQVSMYTYIRKSQHHRSIFCVHVVYGIQYSWDTDLPGIFVEDAVNDGSLWRLYQYDLRAFTQFALVCRSWHTFTREIMFHTLVIPWLDESILQLCSALRQYGSFSRIVLIFTTDVNGMMRLLNWDNFIAALEGCFRLMPQMAKAEFHGTMDKIFGSTVPIQFGRFELLSMRSLKLAGSVGHGGKWHLHSIGRVSEFLETLEIVYFETWPSGYRLPSPLKKLRSLILQCTYLSIPGTIDLLRGPGGDDNSVRTLRKLVIIPSHLQTIPPDITPLLAFDSIGDHLKFLMIHRLDPFRSLACCPGLETFIYISPTSSNILPFLPHTLRRLAISATLLSPTDRFIAYIASESARNLVQLAVALTSDTSSSFMTTIKPFASAIEACKDAGVSLTWIVPGMMGLGLEGWDDATELFQAVFALPKSRLKLT